MFTDLKNLGRGFAIALLALSSLSAVVYHDDVYAGKGNGGGNGGGGGGGNGGGGNGGGGNGGGNGSASGGGSTGSNQNNKSDPGISPESYGSWLSNLTKE